MTDGLNQVWCIDGHDKLSAYLIQIYAAVDAYSRKIFSGIVVPLDSGGSCASYRLASGSTYSPSSPNAACTGSGRRLIRPSYSSSSCHLFGPSSSNLSITITHTLSDGNRSESITSPECQTSCTKTKKSSVGSLLIKRR